MAKATVSVHADVYVGLFRGFWFVPASQKRVNVCAVHCDGADDPFWPCARWCNTNTLMLYFLDTASLNPGNAAVSNSTS